MYIAQEILEKLTCDANEAFVYSVMKGEKSEVSPWFDVYSAPFFTFSDGSIIEFVIEYDMNVLHAKWFADIGDLIDYGHRWAA